MSLVPKVNSGPHERDSSNSGPSVDADPKREHFGLFLLSEELGINQEKLNVDIVAVHGLGGDWEQTWTDSNGKLWLRDFVPVETPTARVMSYGYNSQTAFSKAVTNIDDEARILLRKLISKRTREEERRRPIILISHSLGGIVVKKAMILAHERSTHYADLLNSIRGLVFFGVPHRGSDAAVWVTFAANLLVYAQLGFGTNPNFVKALQSNSQTFADISQQFIERGANVAIRTFYETNKMGNRIIVDKDSACLNLPNEIAVGVAGANHKTMCKFSRPDSQKYILVRDTVAELVDMAIASSAITPAALSAEEIHCLQSLYTSNYEAQKSRIPARIEGTCEWFFESPQYLNWLLDEGSSLLWLSADPGCGKTVLASSLVDEIRGLSEFEKSSTTVCYFFFKDVDESQRSASSALCSILHQLCTANQTLLRYVLDEHRKKSDRFLVEFNALWSVFEAAISSSTCGNVVCVLDGLDECNEDSRNLLIDALVGYYSQNPRTAETGERDVKFLITSRPYPTIERRFNTPESCRQIWLRAKHETTSVDNDIERVVEVRVQEIGLARGMTPLAQQQLARRLIDNADKTFLWVALILDLVENSARVSRKALDNVMDMISGSLDAMYEKVLAQTSDAGHARKLLHIVVAATRPLSVEEINLALHIDEEDKSFDQIDFEPAIESVVRELCGPLLKVFDSRVYLVHQTAKEFLIKKMDGDVTDESVWRHSLDARESNTVLARSCVWYLSLSDLETEVPPSVDKGNREALFGFWSINTSAYSCFWAYAACSWITHYKASGIGEKDPLSKSAKLLCRTGSQRFSTWYTIYAHLIDFEGLEEDEDTSRRYNDLTFAAAFNLLPVLSLLVQDGQDVGLLDGDGHTAFRIAAEEGYSTVTQCLLDNGIPIDATSEDGNTSLHYAARVGREEVVQFLVDWGADIDPINNKGQTPLHLACEFGGLDITTLLLKLNANINATDIDGSTPLHFATRSNTAIYDALLVGGADPTIRDRRGRTSLDLLDQYLMYMIASDGSTRGPR